MRRRLRLLRLGAFTVRVSFTHDSLRPLLGQARWLYEELARELGYDDELTRRALALCEELGVYAPEEWR